MIAMRYPVYLLICFMLLGSCRKNSDNPYHFKGRLVKDCSGTPLAGYKLRLHQKGDLFNSGGGEKGTATTDAQGYFDLVCGDLSGLGTYLRYGQDKPFDVNVFDDLTGLKATDRTFELGTIYERATFTTSLDIQTGSSHPVSDTLFIGRHRSNYDTIHPMNAGTIRKTFTAERLAITGRLDSSVTSIFWGIGRKDFDSALNYSLTHKATEPQYHRINISAGPCAPANTVTLQIP
jgi:hypothetical protein